MEKILGLGPIEKQRTIPGAVNVEGVEHIYIADDGKNDVTSLFKKVTRQITPPLAKNGGAVLEGCKLNLPDGMLFHAIAYHGDIAGWREQIEKGAIALGLATAKVNEGKITTTSGDTYLLSGCEVIFD